MTLGYQELVAAVGAAQGRLQETVAGFDDGAAHAPSGLPGWSRGHVLTHLARNADGLNRMATGVRTGVPQEMYPGGQDARNAAIEEGAGRPVELLAGDLLFTGGRLVRTLSGLPENLLGVEIAWRRPIAAAELPVLRWREVELHHLDLAAGYDCHDWPQEFVTATLAAELPRLAEIAPDLEVPDLPGPELLAWMAGRPTVDGLPPPPPWPFAPARP